MPVKSPLLLSRRLVLRAISLKDAPEGMDLLFDPLVSRTYLLPDYASREDTRETFERIMRLSAREDRLVYGIYLDESLIGWIHDTGSGEDWIEVGYALRPAFWNRGYASEALGCFIREAFRLGWTRVTASHFQDNPASGRVMLKNGMLPSGETKDISYRGEVHPCVCYEIRRT